MTQIIIKRTFPIEFPTDMSNLRYLYKKVDRIEDCLWEIERYLEDVATELVSMWKIDDEAGVEFEAGYDGEDYEYIVRLLTEHNIEFYLNSFEN